MGNINLLKEEVSRIFEIMGISGKNSELLTESVIDDIVSLIIKVGNVKTLSNASALAKLEKEFSIPSGVLNDGDLAKLATGGMEAQSVIKKIISNLSDDALRKMANDFYVNSVDVQSEMLSIQKSISDAYSAGGGFANKTDLTNYANSEAQRLVTTTDPDLVKLVGETQEIVAERIIKMTESVPGFKYLDDVTGAAGKVGDDAAEEATSKADEIAAELNKVLDETPIQKSFDDTNIDSFIDDVVSRLNIKTKGVDKALLYDEVAAQIKTITKTLPTEEEFIELFSKGSSLGSAKQMELFNTAVNNIKKNMPPGSIDLQKPLNFIFRSTENLPPFKKFGTRLYNLYVLGSIVSAGYFVLYQAPQKCEEGSGFGDCVKAIASGVGKSAAWVYYSIKEVFGDDAPVTPTTNEVTPSTTTYTNDIGGFGKFATDNNWGTGTWFFNNTTKRGEHQETPGDDTSWYYYDWDATNNKFVKGTKI